MIFDPPRYAIVIPPSDCFFARPLAYPVTI
jgi:hypothetical protein